MSQKVSFKHLGFFIIVASLSMVEVCHGIEFDSILIWNYSSVSDIEIPEKGAVYVSMRTKPRSGSLSEHLTELHEKYALQGCSSMDNMSYPVSYTVSCLVPNGHESFWSEFLVNLPWVEKVEVTFGMNKDVSVSRELPTVVQRKLPTRVARPTFNPDATFRAVRKLLRETYEQMRATCHQKKRECVEVAPDGEDYMRITIKDIKGFILKQYRYWERLTIEANFYRGGTIKLQLDAKYASGMNDDQEPPLSSFYSMEDKFPREVHQYLESLTAKLSYIHHEIRP